MAVRVSQQVVASLSLSNIGYTQASQVVVAALATSTTTHVRASQITATALVGLAQRVRATQIAISILVWNYEVPVPALFPTLPGLGYSVIKRPKFFTGVGTSAIGREVRVAYATAPLWEWDLIYDYLPDEPTASAATSSDLKTLMGFYLATAGSFAGFAFQDPDDNTVTGQAIGETDGTTTTWTFVRTYGGNDGSGIEPIGWLNMGAPINIYVGGGMPVSSSTYDILNSAGCLQQVRFHSAPTSGQAITADFSFYYSVRFKDDSVDFEKFMNKLWSLKTISLMSQRS
jgi:uncharacterized protein (TIGR02217 family)